MRLCSPRTSSGWGECALPRMKRLLAESHSWFSSPFLCEPPCVVEDGVSSFWIDGVIMSLLDALATVWTQHPLSGVHVGPAAFAVSHLVTIWPLLSPVPLPLSFEKRVAYLLESVSVQVRIHPLGVYGVEVPSSWRRFLSLLFLLGQVLCDLHDVAWLVCPPALLSPLEFSSKMGLTKECRRSTSGLKSSYRHRTVRSNNVIPIAPSLRVMRFGRGPASYHSGIPPINPLTLGLRSSRSRFCSLS